MQPSMLVHASPEYSAVIHSTSTTLYQVGWPILNWAAMLQEEAEKIVSEARKAAQQVISDAKESTQEEQNKKLAEAKSVSCATPIARRVAWLAIVTLLQVSMLFTWKN